MMFKQMISVLIRPKVIMINLSSRAIALIREAEGLNQPSRWPGGRSGITLGIGYDLGYATIDQFESDWGGILSPEELKLLKGAVGRIGEKAHKLAAKYNEIKIIAEQADKVFISRTLPLYSLRTIQAFPGVEELPLDAQGALLSLVMNRGGSMEGPRRKEMVAIRSAVHIKDLKKIAKQLRKMKRLWVDKGQDGLLRRRDAEADLVESAIS